MLDSQYKLKTFPNLDGLRFIAFMMVFLQHGFGDVLYHINYNNSFIRRVVISVASGGNGVSVFFVLSGFLITYLILKEIKTTGKLNVFKFYMRRTLRIWPLYYAVIIFAFLIYPNLKIFIGYGSYGAATVWKYFVFIGNFDSINIEKFFGGRHTLSGGVTWSLAVEEQFYLAWPLFFFVIPKQRYNLIFYFIIICSLIFRLMHHNDSPVLYFHTFSVMNDLAIGGLAAYYATSSVSFTGFFKRLKSFTIIGCYLLGITTILYSDIIFSPPLSALARICSALFFSFIILEQNYSDYSFYKFSNFKYISRLGEITYGLYLLHPICMLMVMLGFRFIFPASNNYVLIIQGCISFVMSIGLATISYRYYESWFLRLKEKFRVREIN